VLELKVYGNGKIYDIHLKVFFIDFQVWFCKREIEKILTENG